MSKKKKKKGGLPTTNELAQTIRRDWNGICPITRIVESQKNKPIKHKKREVERESEI